MKGRMGVVRLSPNEEENLMREELQRRRKLRLQQVREQQSFLSRLVIRKVQQRRQQQLQTLAESLEEQWQQEHSLHLEALHSHYQQTLTAIGEAQRRAKENEPNEEALSHQRVQHQVRAQQRHREALRELHARQLEQEQQQHRHTESRRKALLEEKRRAERVSSLPLPPPNPVESVHLKTRRPLKTSVELLSSNTHCHMIETHTITAAEREEDAAPQPSALQAAEHEFRRLEDLHQQQEDQREEQENRARERGRRALQREHHTQERASLITQLERLQQVDLLRRRQTRPCAPPPQLYSTDVYCEQQRDLENTFQEMYRQQRRLRGDLVPPLFPEPLPAPSTPVLDEDLDVTLDPEEEPKSPETPVSLAPDADPGRRALTKLMERIRRQREGPRGDPEPVQEESVRADNTSSSILENNSEEPSHAPEISDESVVAEAPLTPDPEEHQTSEMQTDTVSQACVLRQQHEQLVLLEELEQKRMELQQRLVLLQQQSQSLPPPCREPEEETSTRRLHQHQQRLLQQNRLHQQCVQEARRRLQEYQNTLHLRSVLMTSAAPPPAVEIKQHSEVPLEHHHHDTPQSQPPGPTEAALPLQDVPPAASVLDSGPNLPLLLTAPPASAPDSHTAHSGPPLPPASVVLELLRRRLDLNKPRDGGEALTQVPDACSAPASNQEPLADPGVSEEAWTQQGVEAHSRTGGVCAPALVRPGRGRPPVSRAAQRSLFLQQMELHELSAILEVDTPVNASLDTECQAVMGLMDEGVSSVSLSIPGAAETVSGAECSISSGRVSRCSWRDTLLHDSRSNSSGIQENHLQRDRDQQYSPCSMSISSGSFSSGDAAPLSAGSGQKSDALQSIIERYGRELRETLSPAGASRIRWSSVLQQQEEPSSSLPASGSLQCSSEDSEVFQPLEPLPDVDSSSSSDKSRRMQGWSEATSKILERLSEQLSLSSTISASSTHLRAPQISRPAPSVSSWSSEEVEHTDVSGVFLAPAAELTFNQSLPHDSAVELPYHALQQLRPEENSITHDSIYDTELSHLAMQQLRPEENSVTHDSCSEVELSHQALQPLRPEDSITRDSLYGADLSHHALQQLRGEFPSEAQPQISADELSVTHNSLCLGSLPEEAEQEVMSVMKQSVLTELLERAQASGEERGILEESMLSFISLPESVESHQHREAEEKGCSREEEKEEIVTWSHRLWSPFEEEEEKKVPLIHQHRASNFQQRTLEKLRNSLQT